jgi:hypothetical protein
MINFRRNKFSAGKAKYPNIYYMTSVSWEEHFYSPYNVYM